MSESYPRTPNTACEICGKPIYRRPVQMASGHVFCSKACYGKSTRKEIPCAVCGKPILAGANKKTCSRACANKHRTGIKYNYRRPDDKVKDQRMLKIRLLEKRGAKCERCNYSKKEILQVHHKNRNRMHNHLSNLELLCPNCHAEEHYLRKSWLGGKLPEKEKRRGAPNG